MSFKKTISVYKEIYNLPEIVLKEQVSDDFLRFYKKVHYFVVIVAYNFKKEIFLLADKKRYCIQESLSSLQAGEIRC